MHAHVILLLAGLLWSLGLSAQSSSNEVAAQRHAQAVQQLQQQHPQAQAVDLSALQKSTPTDVKGCSSCAKQLRPAPTAAEQPQANRADLLAEQERLVARILDLREAQPVDGDLLNKYRRALELNVAALKRLDHLEQRQKKAQR